MLKLRGRCPFWVKSGYVIGRLGSPLLTRSRHFCAGFMLTLEAGDVPMSACKPLVFPPESHIHLTDY
jgi:hypothetical protein